jgi:alkylglycerol monooxygenase
MASVITYAIPGFVGLITLEALWDARKGTGYYSFKDTVTNIVMGSVSQIFGWLIPTYFIYKFFYELSPFRQTPNWLTQTPIWLMWTVILLLDDFFYYWFHRVSHESRLFWNMHVVHHSSDHYNLSVAVRQSWFGGITGWVFYVPIALLGFPPEMMLAAHGLNLLYQFWIHTQFVPRMGVLEYVLNCPSHHRVHHGVNEQYLDKNYGGILIIWDRMFGSYVDEIEKPRYGIIKPLNSFNPVWANLHAWVEMFQEMRQRRTWWEKLRCVWGPPGMTAATPEPEAKNLQTAG